MEENGNQPDSPGRLSPMNKRAKEGGQGGTLEFDPTSRPTGIRAMCLVNMEGRPIVRLMIQGPDDRTLMDSNQDLEDTLALGAFIVEAAADVLDDVAGLLKDRALHEGLGENFELYLEQTETATRRIRERLSNIAAS